MARMVRAAVGVVITVLILNFEYSDTLPVVKSHPIGTSRSHGIGTRSDLGEAEDKLLDELLRQIKVPGLNTLPGPRIRPSKPKKLPDNQILGLLRSEENGENGVSSEESPLSSLLDVLRSWPPGMGTFPGPHFMHPDEQNNNWPTGRSEEGYENDAYTEESQTSSVADLKLKLMNLQKLLQDFGQSKTTTQRPVVSNETNVETALEILLEKLTPEEIQTLKNVKAKLEEASRFQRTKGREVGQRWLQPLKVQEKTMSANEKQKDYDGTPFSAAELQEAANKVDENESTTYDETIVDDVEKRLLSDIKYAHAHGVQLEQIFSDLKSKNSKNKGKVHEPTEHEGFAPLTSNKLEHQLDGLDSDEEP